MARTHNHTAPGPAGLMFDPSRLNAFGLQREREARAALEHWCVSCGQSACHGYGSYAHTDGIWACADPECRALAEARAAEAASPSPIRPVPERDPLAGTLFAAE